METTTLLIPSSSVTALQEANPRLPITIIQRTRSGLLGANLASISLPVDTSFVCVDANTTTKILLHNPNILFEQTGHYILSIKHMAGLPSSQNADLVLLGTMALLLQTGDVLLMDKRNFEFQIQ